MAVTLQKSVSVMLRFRSELSTISVVNIGRSCLLHSIYSVSIDILTPVEDAVLPQLGLIKVPRTLVSLRLDPASLHLGLGLDLRLDMAAGGSGGHRAVLLGLLKNQQVCSSGMKQCVLNAV